MALFRQLVQGPWLLPALARALRSWLAVGGVATFLGACQGDGADEASGKQIELFFEARFADQAFDCGAEYAGLGTSDAIVRPLDLRLFVHDVALVRPTGEPETLLLEDDGLWQRDGVALLDFEDASGTCDTGSSEVNRALRGRVADDDYTALSFTIGIPTAKNHLDGANAPAPFNAPGMWWSWQGGYKYMKVDVASDANPGGFFFHLGGTNCDGSPTQGYACQHENLARIEVELAETGTVVLDLAPLYRSVDVNAKPDMETDFIPGCMASSTDPECALMLDALGLGSKDESSSGAGQQLFRP
jgi:uncharacterized repeat protein (TIGR04052 family)